MSARPTIGFAGMTHLGINSAVAAAERGFAVICYDPDVARIKAMAAGDPGVREPGLTEAMAEGASRLAFTTDVARLSACDLIYVSPDVPTDDAGASDLAPVRALIAAAGASLRSDAILIVLSQVPPGFTRALGRDAATTFYQVETLVFGRAYDRALNPERFIVGCARPQQPLPAPYVAFLAAFGCPILPMRYESAELAKISINICLAASISVANTLAELSERIGADWAEIAGALRLDGRIGPKAYLAPGLGIAGGNIERDLATVCRFADQEGTDARTVRAFVANSAYRRDWALRTLRATLPPGDDRVLAVLGLAYKEDTASTKNSPSLALLGALPDLSVRAFDPAVAAQPEFHPRLAQAADPLDACAGADALAVMTPWREFRGLDPAALASRMRGRLVLDPYRVLDGAAFRASGFAYHALGAPAA